MKNIMNKIFLALLLFSIFYSVAIVESQEICESYTAYQSFFEPQNCPIYCCGSCTNRYCCGDLSDRLIQKSCSYEDCDSYYDTFGYFYNFQNCTMVNEFCCGSCDYRFCCSYPTRRLNQSSCPVGTPSTKRTTTYSPYSTSSNTLYYVIGIGGVFILFIMCFVFIILNIKSKQRGLQTIPVNNNNVILSGYPGTQPVNGFNSRYNNNGTVVYPTNNNAQLNTRSAFVVADNSAYNYDMNKIYNPNIKDELPPSYDTINLKEKKPNETAETNS